MLIVNDGASMAMYGRERRAIKNRRSNRRSAAELSDVGIIAAKGA